MKQTSGAFERKAMLVVGAGSGIGAAAAHDAGLRGARVLCADIDGAGALTTARRIVDAGGEAEALTCDVTSPDSMVEGVSQVLARLGALDALIYCAGATHTSHVLDLPRGEWDRVILVNLTGAYVSSQAAAQAMVKQGRGGAIVMVTSQLAQVAVRNKCAYLASKGGMESLVRGMALDLAPHGIRVNAVAPGPVLTALTRERFSDPNMLEWTLSKIPLGRLGQPNEVAAAISFLAGQESAWVTGTTIVVDGGYLAG